MTRTDAIAWCQSKLGQAMDYDGRYGAQCFDFFNFYYEYLTGRNPYSDGYGLEGAKDIWNVPNARFTFVTNNPNDLNQLPSPGDIVIYDGGLLGSGGYGHVAVFGESTNAYYEQNWGGMYVKKNIRKFTGHEIGWLSFNGFNTATPPTGGNVSDIITDLDVGLVRIANTELEGYPFDETHAGKYDAQEMAAWKGNTLRNLFNQKWNQGEAYRNRRNAQMANYPVLEAQVGALTSANETLTNQNKDLSKKVDDQTTAITTLNQTVTELQDENTALKKENADLKAQVAAGGGDVTINFNFMQIFLWNLIKVFGTK